MTLTVEIPDALVDALAPNGGDLSRTVLEAMALEGYRTDRLAEYDVQRLLGFESRMDVHGFLKEHGVYLNYGIEALEHDIRESDRMLALLAAEAAAEQRAK
jgi:hypothetical protein